MGDVKNIERKIRDKLESSGAMAKLRAMVVEASLRAVDDANEEIFVPSEAFKAMMTCKDGPLLMSVVSDFLLEMGLLHTRNVLLIEAGLAPTSLTAGADLRREANVPGGGVCALAQLLHREGGSPAQASSDKPSVEASVKAGPPAALGASSEGQETLYGISRFTDRQFVRQRQIEGQQLQLEYLTNCTVVSLDALDSMNVDDCIGGEIIVAACEGSIFLRTCKDMTVSVACKQLRTRDCSNLDIRLFAATDPVVESSTGITFRPFNLQLPGLRSAFASARLDPKTNRFIHVYDFSADDASLPRPHFTVAFPQHGLTLEARGLDYGTPESPPEIGQLLQGKLNPAASSESSSKSHNIKTGAATWTGSMRKDSASLSTSGNPVAPAAAAAAVPPLPAPPSPASSYSSFDDADSDSGRPKHDDDDDDEF